MSRDELIKQIKLARQNHTPRSDAYWQLMSAGYSPIEIDRIWQKLERESDPSYKRKFKTWYKLVFSLHMIATTLYAISAWVWFSHEPWVIWPLLTLLFIQQIIYSLSDEVKYKE